MVEYINLNENTVVKEKTIDMRLYYNYVLFV